MIGIFLCIIAFVTTLYFARQSLANGLIAVLSIGYAYGIVRARLPDVGTHFLFDAALIALYAANFYGQPPPALVQRSELAKVWATLLIAWPIVCMCYAPAISDTQPILVQLVGFRALAFVIPCLVLGARLTRADMDRLAPAVAILNLVALLFGMLEYVFGIEAFVPHTSAVAEIVYMTRDISSGSDTFYRIPSIFLDSHGYGGVMALSVPFVAHGLESGRRVRILCWCGLAAAGIGVFLCGSRLPVVVLLVSTLYVLFSLRIRASMFVAVAITGIGLYYLVTHVDRMQRFLSLGDTDTVTLRISGSVNASFLSAALDYPLGAGLASAWGTSIPYFLQSQAHTQIGIENEYGHMVLEQGIPGLVMWVSFILTCIFRKPFDVPLSGTAQRFLQALVIMTWVSASLGVGVLSGIPGSTMLLSLMGMRFGRPAHALATRALRHVGQAKSKATISRGPSRAPAPAGALFPSAHAGRKPISWS